MQQQQEIIKKKAPGRKTLEIQDDEEYTPGYTDIGTITFSSEKIKPKKHTREDIPINEEAPEKLEEKPAHIVELAPDKEENPQAKDNLKIPKESPTSEAIFVELTSANFLVPMGVLAAITGIVLIYLSQK